MTRPDLVVFDCDGVLVDTERLTVGVEARVLGELGWPISPAEVVERWMGKSSAANLADVAARLGPEGAREFDERTTAELHATFERELTAIDGVVALLDHLDAREVATCVASSGTHERIRRTLGITGLHPRFDGRIYSATEVRHGKPAPDLFLHAAAAMGVPAVSCAVVEDSVYGVRAGVAAGMTVYGFAGGLSSAEALAAEGAITFDRMADLLEVLAPAPARS
ncbi:HAD family hydrolase [Nocardioides panacis]|uniref:HAD family hydrolase n=1 Tax=Nocardioides panacis TaxID=2849501 RepID=A0A975T1D8_9ACTN|nr:HAD family hydrolase [Nocardioides panacis]QWZ09809.1 HAD family hydrolase [Nocardioides panacis]